MNEYLSSIELAELIGCKHNQRSIMIRWLEANNWPFVVDRNGLPKVARAYRDQKLGIWDQKSPSRFDAGPNLEAFAVRPKRRPRPKSD